MPGDDEREEGLAAETAPAQPAPQGDNENDPSALAVAAAELRDKYLRAVAESENLRKRADREIADARTYGVAGFARDVLGVADNLARALEAIEPEARAAAEGTLKALLEGVELTRRELHKTLEKHGIRIVDPAGEKFDPNFHQAMFEVPEADAPPGIVVQVIQPGYAIGERVLRPALVGVAKAPGRNGNQVRSGDAGPGK